MKFIKTFLSDDDGISQKDFLLVITVVVFFGLIVFGTVEWVRGKDISGLLSLIESMSGVTITVVGGIMGVNAVQTYYQGKQQAVNYTPTQMNGYSPYMNNMNGNYYSPYNNMNGLNNSVVNPTQNQSQLKTNPMI
jgi:hypothetical protein